MRSSFATPLLVLSIVPCAGAAEELDLKKLFQQGIPVSPLEVMERDLNGQRKAPALPSSAVSGEGVFETLRMISKLVTRGVARRVLHGPEAIVV